MEVAKVIVIETDLSEEELERVLHSMIYFGLAKGIKTIEMKPFPLRLAK